MPRFIKSSQALGTGNDTSTVPNGATRCLAEVWGGGGGGSISTSAEGGGGGGAYARSLINVSSGQILYLTLAAGGAQGQNGGSSLVSVNSDRSNPFVLAAGGTSGGGPDSQLGGVGGTVADSIGDVRVAGGNGANGQGGGGSRAGSGGGGPGTAWSAGGPGSIGVAGNPGAGGNNGLDYEREALGSLIQINLPIFRNNLYVATATDANESIYSSIDGITWTQRQTLSIGSFIRLIWTGVNYVATTTESVYTSTNGTTWTIRNYPAGFNSIGSGGILKSNTSGFIVSYKTLTGEFITSNDHGVTWTLGSNYFLNFFPTKNLDVADIAYLPSINKFFMTAKDNRSGSQFETYFITTQDFVSFEILEIKPYAYFAYLVECDNVLYRSIDTNSNPGLPSFGIPRWIEKSTDGINWQKIIDQTTALDSVEKLTDRYVMLTSSFAHVSFDTESWQRVPDISLSSIVKVNNDFYNYDIVFDFFTGTTLDAFRKKIDFFTNITPTLVNSNVDYFIKKRPLTGTNGGFVDQDPSSGGLTAAGGGGGANGGGNSSVGGAGDIKLFYNRPRKIVS